MKRILAGFLMAALFIGCFSSVASAADYALTPVNFPVLVNGAGYSDAEQPILNYQGNTYIPLAKIGELLKVKYLWNEEKRQVEIGEDRSFNVSELKAAAGAEKLLVTLGYPTMPNATTYAFEKVNGSWVEKYRMEGFVGRNGISISKREGDGETPAGVYGLSTPFGTADDPGSTMEYRKLTANDFWVDDVKSEFYNKWWTPEAGEKDWDSAEDLSKETTAYKYAMVIEYNTDPVVAGNGSAIFLHCSTGGATAGCISVAEEDMIKLLEFVDENTQIVIASSLRELKKY